MDEECIKDIYTFSNDLMYLLQPKECHIKTSETLRQNQGRKNNGTDRSEVTKSGPSIYK